MGRETCLRPTTASRVRREDIFLGDMGRPSRFRMRKDSDRDVPENRLAGACLPGRHIQMPAPDPPSLAKLSLRARDTCIFLLLAALPTLGQPGIPMDIIEVCPAPQLASIAPTGQVAALIAQLSDESPGHRDAAAQALLGMCPA